MSFLPVGLSVSTHGGVASNASRLYYNRILGVPEEFEDKRRFALVYLFTRAVQGLENATSTEFQHWILVLDFGNGSYRTIEGLCDLNSSTLQGSYKKHRPMEEGKYELLGSVFMSPAEVKKIAEGNELNGKPYLTMLQNCQEWVKKAASKLGWTVRQHMAFFKTIKEERPFFAHASNFIVDSYNGYCATSNNALNKSMPPQD